MREATTDELETVDGGFFFWGSLVALLKDAGKAESKTKDLESQDRLGNFEIQ